MVKLPAKPRRGDFTKEMRLKECREKARLFMNMETKLGEAGLAKLCRVPVQTIRDFFAGSYSDPSEDDDSLSFGDDSQDIEGLIERAIARYREQSWLHLPERYAATDPSRIVESTIMAALSQRRSAAVLAESGCGKTTAARLVSIREPEVLFIPCDCHDFRPYAFLSRIGAAIGFSRQSSTVWQLQRSLAETLKGGKVVIVVDDSHYLINPNKPSRSAALDIVKDLETHAGTPFVLLGVPELWTTLNKRSTGGWFDQLLGRIEMHHTIRCEMIREADVASVAESLGVSCTGPVLNSLTELAHRPGGFRHVEKAARWAKRQGASQLTRDSLRQFFRVSGTEGIVIGKEAQTSKTAATAAKPQDAGSAVA